MRAKFRNYVVGNFYLTLSESGQNYTVMLSENAVNLTSSSLAGVIARSICHPIDTCKAKLQSGNTFNGLSDLISKTLRTEGIRGFYKGVGAALVGGIPGVCLYISTYEASNKALAQYSSISSNPFMSYFISGMLAEVVCCAAFLPVDVVKERLQVQSNRPERQYAGSLDALKTIVREEGVRGLYKGYTATVFSYGPFSAIYFPLYEWAKKTAAGRNVEDPKKDLSFAQNLACSSFAGSIASFVTNPLDVAKLRYQIQRNTASSAGAAATVATTTMPVGEVVYTGLIDALRKLYAQGGMRFLFRGALTRVAFHTPNVAIIMASYDQFKILLSKK